MSRIRISQARKSFELGWSILTWDERIEIIDQFMVSQ